MVVVGRWAVVGLFLLGKSPGAASWRMSFLAPTIALFSLCCLVVYCAFFVFW